MSDKITYETGMAELETLVSDMEAGKLSLEESFAAYKRAMRLYKQLSALLDAGDRKIEEMTKTGVRDIADEVNE